MKLSMYVQVHVKKTLDKKKALRIPEKMHTWEKIFR